MFLRNFVVGLWALIGMGFASQTVSATNYYPLSVPEEETIGQFHGSPDDADLILFMAGNQFVVMEVEGKMDPSHKIAAQQWIDFLRLPQRASYSG